MTFTDKLKKAIKEDVRFKLFYSARTMEFIICDTSNNLKKIRVFEDESEAKEALIFLNELNSKGMYSDNMKDFLYGK